MQTYQIVVKKNIQIRVEKLLKLNDKDFKLHTGLTKYTFYKMLDYLTIEFDKCHEKGSYKGIGVVCRFVLAITYWRDYRPMRQMGLDYDVSKTTVCDSVKWVELVLSNWKEIKIEDIKTEIQKAEDKGIKVNCIIGDVEEQPIERPTINQENSYSGKKKRHTTKNQIIIDEKGNRILNLYNATGSTHDYQIINNSGIIPILEGLNIGGMFDSGYQGIQKQLSNAIIPIKKSKNHELTEEEKKHNTELSKKRVKVENVNREIKIFRIMKETYRNHMNRYDEKMTIMCGIFNMNHEHQL